MSVEHRVFSTAECMQGVFMRLAEQGYSVKEISSNSGISTNNLSRIKSGSGGVSGTVIDRMATYLNLTVGEVLNVGLAYCRERYVNELIEKDLTND